MSYILEALKKADADRERERAGVPTCGHSSTRQSLMPTRWGRTSHWRWAVPVAALLVAAGAWLWFDDDAPAPPETVAPRAGCRACRCPGRCAMAVPAPVAPAPPASTTAMPAAAVPAPARAPVQITARPATAAPRPVPAAEAGVSRLGDRRREALRAGRTAAGRARAVARAGRRRLGLLACGCQPHRDPQRPGVPRGRPAALTG